MILPGLLAKQSGVVLAEGSLKVLKRRGFIPIIISVNIKFIVRLSTPSLITLSPVSHWMPPSNMVGTAAPLPVVKFLPVIFLKYPVKPPSCAKFRM